MRNPFDDPAHRESEELAYEADRLVRAGRLDEAEPKYQTAGERELQVARSVDYHPHLRSIFAISAVACFVHGRHWNEAARAAHEFLARPDLLTDGGTRELEDLLDQALRSRELASVLGDGNLVPLEIRLQGGQVGRGVAPTKLIQEREEVVEALLLRIAEWRTGREFRNRGASPLAASMVFYEAPARAASYGIRLFVGSPPQAGAPGTDCTAHDAVGAFLALADHLSTGVDSFQTHVRNTRYASAFVRAFRDLAPDGTRLTNVTFSSSSTRYRQSAVSFVPETRARLSRALVRNEVEPVEVAGLLKVVRLTRPRHIVVHADDGAHKFGLRPGEHDDTIGAKLNQSVHVIGQRDRRTGTIFAVDVEPLDS